MIVVFVGETPYKCKECDWAGRQKKALVEHMRKHTGEIARCGFLTIILANRSLSGFFLACERFLHLGTTAILKRFFLENGPIVNRTVENTSNIHQSENKITRFTPGKIT